MKKAWCFLVFFAVAAVFSFAADMPNRHIYIEGKSAIPEQRTFFMDNFKMEAASLGYVTVPSRAEAGYTFRFMVVPRTVTYDDGTEVPAPPDEKQFLIMISFFRNSDMAELVTFDFPFTDLDEMYTYNQLLFLNAAVNIPPIDENEYQLIAQGDTGQGDVVIQEDDEWRNKWLYLNASFNFPVTFYVLQPDGLIDGKGVYEGSFTSPRRTAPLDNKVVALPGLTLGAEVQILDWLSLEPNLQVNWEYLNDKDFLNMALGLSVMFPLKFRRNIIMEPYIALVYPLPFSIPLFSFAPSSDVYDSFPLLGFGLGLQVGIKGFGTGIIFLDLNYMYYYGDAGIKNNHGELYPEPPVIHYQRSVIGLGVGYKFGIVDR